MFHVKHMFCQRVIVLKPCVGFCLGKCRFQMVDANELSFGAVDLNLDDIKTRLERGSFLIEVISGGTHNVELLALIHGVLTPQKRIGGAGLYLNKNDSTAFLGDNIDLTEFIFIILFKNFVMVVFQMIGGEFFAERAELSVGK